MRNILQRNRHSQSQSFRLKKVYANAQLRPEHNRQNNGRNTPKKADNHRYCFIISPIQSNITFSIKQGKNLV